MNKEISKENHYYLIDSYRKEYRQADIKLKLSSKRNLQEIYSQASYEVNLANFRESPSTPLFTHLLDRMPSNQKDVMAKCLYELIEANKILDQDLWKEILSHIMADSESHYLMQELNQSNPVLFKAGRQMFELENSQIVNLFSLLCRKMLSSDIGYLNLIKKQTIDFSYLICYNVDLLNNESKENLCQLLSCLGALDIVLKPSNKENLVKLLNSQINSPKPLKVAIRLMLQSLKPDDLKDYIDQNVEALMKLWSANITAICVNVEALMKLWSANITAICVKNSPRFVQDISSSLLLARFEKDQSKQTLKCIILVLQHYEGDNTDMGMYQVAIAVRTHLHKSFDCDSIPMLKSINVFLMGNSETFSYRVHIEYLERYITQRAVLEELVFLMQLTDVRLQYGKTIREGIARIQPQELEIEAVKHYALLCEM